MSNLYDRHYVCPVCGFEFTSKQVKTSAVRAKERRKDFHTIFSGDNPTFYGVICCSKCGFTQFESDFKESVSPTNKEIIKMVVSKNWKEQDFNQDRSLQDAIKVHKIAMVSYMALKTKQSVIAKLMLRLAWFYDELGDENESLKYTKLALDAFVKSYETEKQEDAEEKELEVIYLIGELNRQLKNYKEAIKWYSMVVRHEFAYKNRLLKTYAKDQWALAAEEYNQTKGQEGLK